MIWMNVVMPIFNIGIVLTGLLDLQPSYLTFHLCGDHTFCFENNVQNNHITRISCCHKRFWSIIEVSDGKGNDANANMPHATNF